MASKKIGPLYIPGDIIDLSAIVRVNLAGEQGAVDIYSGQLKIRKNQHLQEMLAQEYIHRDTFQKIAHINTVRETIFAPIWKKFSYGLGILTGIMGLHACMATTAAIEEVIDQHYQKQLQYLHNIQEKQFSTIIAKFQKDEHQHYNISYQQGANKAFPIIFPMIRLITKTAIWLSERF